MALVARFEERPLTPTRLHSPVLCGYNAVDVQGTRVLQLETYGSDNREMPAKSAKCSSWMKPAPES